MNATDNHQEHMLGSLLAAQRAKVVAALTRHFRDIDLAEEAFQDAAVRALKNWSEHGHPRDPAAWLIMTGRNAAIDRLRRQKRFEDHARDNPATRDPEDGESRLAEEIDLSGLRDDVLRLMFMCCHEELPISDQLARALVVRPKAMEQRITRTKRKAAATVARLDTPTPFRNGPGASTRCRQWSICCSTRGIRPGAETFTSGPNSAKRRSGSPGCCSTWARLARTGNGTLNTLRRLTEALDRLTGRKDGI